MERADFEGMPVSEQYERVVQSWNAFSTQLDNYFETGQNPQAIADALAAHLNVVPNFIQNYIEASDASEYETYCTVTGALIRLHQTTVAKKAVSYGLDLGEFALISEEQNNDNIRMYVESVQEAQQDDVYDDSDVTNDIYMTLRNALLHNATTLMNGFEAKKQENLERKEMLRSHVVDVGKTALGTLIGVAAFTLLSRKRKG